jgi:hypothetical protein
MDADKGERLKAEGGRQEKFRPSCLTFSLPPFTFRLLPRLYGWVVGVAL